MIPAPTARLRFREMGEPDLDAMAALLGDPEVMRYYPRPRTRDEALEWIRWSRRNYAEHGYGLWVVETHDGEFVGDCGLTWQPVGERRVLEVGYHVVPAFQGRGYATEAARACLDLATGPVGEQHVVAVVHPDNGPSRRVAEKLGLRLEQVTEVHGRTCVVLGTRPPRIVLHLHPGWPYAGSTVLESIAEDGVYRHQWETGTSNGGLTAHVGGDRWRWESRLFAGRYDDAPAADRPVYGAWQRHEDPYGAAPRFGSAYVVLRPEVVERATFCWPDSVRHDGVAHGPEVLEELGRRADAARDEGDLDPLDDYVEAHVHGGVVLARDVEALVLDPSDREAQADVLDRLDCRVEEHPGYAVTADGIDPGYRGRPPVDLARRLGGAVTPARLGGAARSGRHDPQDLKRLWHCLARYGAARDHGPTTATSRTDPPPPRT